MYVENGEKWHHNWVSGDIGMGRFLYSEWTILLLTFTCSNLGFINVGLDPRNTLAFSAFSRSFIHKPYYFEVQAYPEHAANSSCDSQVPASVKALTSSGIKQQMMQGLLLCLSTVSSSSSHASALAFGRTGEPLIKQTSILDDKVYKKVKFSKLP